MQTLPLDPAQRLFTLQEAARICGVSPHVVRYWIKKGKMPVVRIDTTLKIDRHDLEAVIQGAKQSWTPHKEFASSARKGHQNRQQQKGASNGSQTAV